MAPFRSVTSIPPSGRKAMPQGWSRPSAMVSTRIGALSVSKTSCADTGMAAIAGASAIAAKADLSIVVLKIARPSFASGAIGAEGKPL